jgi:hypothetical protein
MPNIPKIIPESEMDQFHDFLRIFSGGEVILLEDSLDDDSLYLLREGAVSIYKKSGEENRLVSTIEAVNFFGEMALIMGDPRSATVVAASDEVVIYKLQREDIKTILNNPIWSELLVSRLVYDLKIANDQVILASDENQKIKNKYDDLVANTALLFQAYHEAILKLSNNHESSPKEWEYFTALDAVNLNLLRNSLPEIINAMHSMNESAFTILNKRQVLPKILKQNMP